MKRRIFLTSTALLLATSTQGMPTHAQVPGSEKPMEVFTPQQLVEDFRIVREALEKGHPGIYRYVSKKTLDKQFDEAEKKLDHPMDVYGFFRILAPMVARIECGHTN